MPSSKFKFYRRKCLWLFFSSVTVCTSSVLGLSGMIFINLCINNIKNDVHNIQFAYQVSGHFTISSVDQMNHFICVDQNTSSLHLYIRAFHMHVSEHLMCVCIMNFITPSTCIRTLHLCNSNMIILYLIVSEHAICMYLNAPYVYIRTLPRVCIRMLHLSNNIIWFHL